jgi:LPXTG-site transpeptidase (sortase) family protein
MSVSIRNFGGAVATALLLTVALTGCSSSDAPQGLPQGAPAAVQADDVPITNPYDGLRPTRVRVPKIEADSSLLAVAVDSAGQIAVPTASKPMQAAWYRVSPVPGAVGPAIILGHVDGDQQEGIFAKLGQVAKGDEIIVDRSDGQVLKFVVSRTEQIPKETFPKDAVYGQTDKPELRLITCGGVFDHAVHSYKDNVIVYANLAS